MIRKGQPLKLTKSGSMRAVYEAVQAGHSTRHTITIATAKKEGQVASALYNLVFTGMVAKIKDANGRIRYVMPERKLDVSVPQEMRGASSIFDIGTRMNTKEK